MVEKINIRVIEKSYGQVVAVVNGVESKEYFCIRYNSFQISPDGTRCAFIALRDHKWFVVVDGVESRGYEQITSFEFSPDGKRYKFIAKKRIGERYYEIAVVDGVESDPYLSIRSFQFSSDGKKYGFIAEKGENRWIVVIDDIVSKEYDGIYFNDLDMDNERFYGVRDKKVYMVVNGIEQEIK